MDFQPKNLRGSIATENECRHSKNPSNKGRERAIARREGKGPKISGKFWFMVFGQ